ncbi:hypothetical protein EVAR_36628_1 [Eumeta japonica]|uniref:Uncharacterized protein n=1 Tax=Eumeta variegata TaxID=151549 RepID=A0A4C1YNT9_EUMVA|nr:hypothetical protein EVAR_36628_1 [Eumeta japonica]
MSSHIRPNASTSQRYYRKPSNDWQIRNIKNRACQTSIRFEERKLKQLLMHEELGDRKPSQFLRHLQGLAGPDISMTYSSQYGQAAYHKIYKQSSPGRQHLLWLLADLADRVHEIAPPSLQVACTSTVSAHASTLENLTR